MFPVTNLFKYLEGTWSIDRTIAEENGPQGTFKGNVIFKEDENLPKMKLNCIEAGEIEISGHKQQVTQQFEYNFVKSTEASVSIAGGATIHKMNLIMGSDDAAYNMEGVIHRGNFTAVNDKNLKITWNITAGDKVCNITSNYTKLS